MEQTSSEQTVMSLFEQHKEILDNAVKANHERTFYSQYPEHPKAYGEEAPAKGEEAYKIMLNNSFDELLQDAPSGQSGEEESPYLQSSLGITYPTFENDVLLDRAATAYQSWRKTSIEDRAGLLIESLERIKNRFFEIAHATQHTTGQSFMMSFQASGPHSNDRALEAIAMAYDEMHHFPEKIIWDKPMGKFNVTLEKTYQPIPKGIGLVIGCSTFPIWNTVPGLYADLMTGNVAIVKPHPKVVLPIAIVVAEIQKTFKDNGIDPNTVQLAVDSSDHQIAKDLAEHPDVKLIDFTGNSEFGSYLETLPGKTVFTEKTGVNSVILDSTNDLDAVLQNLAFSVSLYSGQMCTAPQNFFVPEGGIEVEGETVSYDDVVSKIKDSVSGLVNHPKMGAGTLGTVQNPATVTRVQEAKDLGGNVVLESTAVTNEEYSNSRTCSPVIIEVNASDHTIYEKELFGPIVLIIKTKNTEESVAIARDMAMKHGAITCAAYSTDDATIKLIEDEMNQAYTPVTLNLTGFIWVNQHAAFSDFHVTGGNPAGNASFTDPLYVNRRFVWVGNRRLAN